MTSTRTILMLILQATFVGCQTQSKVMEVRHVDPVLSSTLSCEELVDHLNSQNKDLQSWRCMDTRVHVSVPKLPTQRLTGTLSCSAPSSFRLMADNFVAQADFGSNDQLCWAYVKPGDPVVMTWHHEDSHLLEFVPGGFPRLDPDWLMVVLGVQPLDAKGFNVQHGPAGSRELWLVAIEESASGKPMRRVIKVDSVSGMAREHALVDHNGDNILSAKLSHHKSCGGSLIPHRIEISFPPQKTDLTLDFKNVEANCYLTESLWVPPGNGRLARVDLGDWVRESRGDLLLPELTVDRSNDEDTRLDGVPYSRGGSTMPDFDDQPDLDRPSFDDEPLTDGRYFGKEEQDDRFSPEVDDDVSVTPNAFRPVGFQPAPDFDIVAPPQKPRSNVRWNPFR